ncbi:DUF6371 domain-containing protein [Sinomicrobium kalidii]|uniref:DUF6371 domain-containing protein n=1 Tax=Sinomicrobium kalidii TaxID=2900738 RepID=UPI001E520A55|nr:DUF6371 domain-containing protein [Sinomicrobium kalidii]UGU17716.1 DUF6371 domain-containing protein [Sinomicrobium kalidii]
MQDLKFDKNRRKIKYCPCNKGNKDGKFVPYIGYHDKGYCHSCNRTFLPDNGTIVEPYTPQPQPTTYHDIKLVNDSMSHYDKNSFVLFLNTIFTADEVATVIKKYRIGSSNHYPGATVFWQIDNHNRVHHGKIFQYDPGMCKKQKINSVRSVLKLQDFNLKQCLFGLHLVNDNVKSVMVVESEKTAILMSIFKPDCVWLATGGLSELKAQKLAPVKRLSIIACPDKGKFEMWQKKAQELNKQGYRVMVNDWLEKQGYPTETDFADILISELSKPAVEPQPKPEPVEHLQIKEPIKNIENDRIAEIRSEIARYERAVRTVEKTFNKAAKRCKVEWYAPKWYKPSGAVPKIKDLLYYTS